MPVTATEKLALTAGENWLRQPTTISGIGTIVGTLVGGLIQAAFGDTSVSVVLGLACKGLVHLVINDNTATPPA